MSGLQSLTRRDFLCALAGCAAAATSSCVDPTHTPFFRNHLKELSQADVRAILDDLEHEYSQRYGREVVVGCEEPLDGVEFAYALDLSRCIGCRKCVYGCIEENNQSRDPQVQWIRVLQMESEKGIDFAHADPYYDAEQVPEPGHFYLPVACQQCRNAPCVKSCPVNATWQEPDGIVVIDYDWCIGCRCCMSACPYGARHFNWSDPEIPSVELNTDMHLLGNRPRPKGVVEKCTFCIQRVREGRYPACVEVCPTGSRKFGNLRDPESEIRYILEHERIFVLKSELNTRPRFYYFYS